MAIFDQNLLWAAKAKIYNSQDRLLKFYTQLGHPETLGFTRFGGKNNELSTKNRVPSQNNRSIVTLGV
jgi:hypothetical protein